MATTASTSTKRTVARSGAGLVLMMFAWGLTSARVAQGASSEAKSAAPVSLYGAADESSAVLETVSAAAALTPIAEMQGAGGIKWFMVKAPSGNVGWIKADSGSMARQVDEHFRAQPRDIGSVGPVMAPGESGSKTSARGSMTIPVQVRGRHVVVPVTFNDAVTGNLVLDTGASQTMISKRIANDLRLYSTGGGTRIGIGGAVFVSTSSVDSVRVGDAEVRNLRVSIHDSAFEDGLLGIDFLGRFQISLDMEKRVLTLAPRKS